VQDLAYGRVIAQSIDLAVAGQNAEYAKGTSFESAAAAGYEKAQADFAKAMSAADMASDMMRSSQFNTGMYADKMQGELAEGNYDAMEVSFKISSPVELTDPYMVVLFKFRERDAKPGQDGLMIHAKSLGPIGPKPKYFHVLEGGMPRGFKYLDCEVRIYDRGREIATNTSPKRVELTRADAQKYLLIDHLVANKNATVAATMVRGTLPQDQRQRLSLEQLARTFHAKVGLGGKLLGLYEDEACGTRVEDAAVLAAASEVFFVPALEKGKPVEGTVRVRLGEI